MPRREQVFSADPDLLMRSNGPENNAGARPGRAWVGYPTTCTNPRLSLVLLIMSSCALCGCPGNLRDGGDVPNDNAAPNGDATPGSDLPPGDDSGPGSDPADDAGQPAVVLECLTCHALAMGERRAVVNDSGAGGHTLGREQLTSADCEWCHDTTRHPSGSVRLWENPTGREAAIELAGDPSKDPAEADKVTRLCRACHDEEDYAGHQVRGDWQPACTACHNLHDPGHANLTLVSGSVYNRTLDVDQPVVFSSRTGPGSFNDGDPTALDGICQVCHADTFYHRQDGSRVAHFDGEDCTTCHRHDTGFLATDVTSCTVCHSRAQGDRRAVVSESGTGGHALHGDAPADADCAVCHEMTAHRQGTVRLWTDPNDPSTIIELSGDPSIDVAASEKLTPFCRACHGEADYAAHQVGGEWRPACTACHDLHDPANTNLALVSTSIRNQTLGIDKPVVFRGPAGAGSFADGDSTAHDGICQVCHTATLYHRHDGSRGAHLDGRDCTRCHPHSVGFRTRDQSSCLICHSRAQGGRSAVVRASGAGGHTLRGTLLANADCAVCHEMTRHRRGTVRLWDDPNDPASVIELSDAPSVDDEAAEQLIPFCGACHDAGDYAVHEVGGSWEPACTACHDLHDPRSDNLMLISTSIYSRTLDDDKSVEFSSRTGHGSFDDGDPASLDGLCQVCHTATAFHLHDGSSLPHLDGDDCTICHTHDASFVTDASTSCSICHRLPQGDRRAVAGEFNLASGHVHGEAVIDEDCTVCHDMTAHQEGRVRLRNVDDPENPAAVISLSDNPLSNPAEAAKLEPFCLACHDEDGAGGTAPFTDGADPPAIDADLWASASHGAGQMTCVGDGETFGCHSTGHGSVKVKMLAPWDASPTGVEGDMLREEEGLCYSCHDADGPAATDIESQFALATRHNVSSLDQADDSKVECTHCHNPHEVSETTPLTNPDSGGLWTGTGEAFCLTCHDGSPPAGVSFPPTSPGTGFDKSAFVDSIHDVELGNRNCRHCHEPHGPGSSILLYGPAQTGGSFSPTSPGTEFDRSNLLDGPHDAEVGHGSCRHCHRAHGSTNIALLKERYVMDDYNEYSTGDGDYAACWMCHDEDSTIERENAFEYRHEKHVKDERSPCITCHDVHTGFDATEPGLIDMAYAVGRGYDIEFIDGADGSTSFWIDTAQNEGNCLITCHGEEHDPKDYDRAPLPATDCSACH